MPSPFRILYYLVKHIHFYKRKTTETNRQVEIYQNYRKTLVEILGVKLASDNENSPHEDFEDLRQDIRNHITEKEKNNEKTVSEQFRNLEESIAKVASDCIRNETKMLREEIRKKQGDINGLKEELKDVKDLLKTLLNEKRKE